MNIKRRSNCPVTFALDLIGDKWSLLIIRDIIILNKKYYHEFIDSDESISTNILADRLQKLEQFGIISKSKDENHGKKFIYAPTRKALDLAPMIIEMVLWSAKYDAKTGAPDTVVSEIKKDKNKYITNILEKFTIPLQDNN